MSFSAENMFGQLFAKVGLGGELPNYSVETNTAFTHHHWDVFDGTRRQDAQRVSVWLSQDPNPPASQLTSNCQCLKLLRHPYILRIFDYVESSAKKGCVYLITERVRPLEENSARDNVWGLFQVGRVGYSCVAVWAEEDFIMCSSGGGSWGISGGIPIPHVFRGIIPFPQSRYFGVILTLCDFVQEHSIAMASRSGRISGLRCPPIGCHPVAQFVEDSEPWDEVEMPREESLLLMYTSLRIPKG